MFSNHSEMISVLIPSSPTSHSEFLCLSQWCLKEQPLYFVPVLHLKNVEGITCCDVINNVCNRSASCPFDQSFWWSIQEDQFGIKLLFQLQLTGLSHLKQGNRIRKKKKQNSQSHEIIKSDDHKVNQSFTRKMSVQSLRMRSTHGSSSNMMEWLIPLKNSLTNFPMTSTTEAYSPMMLHKRSIINQSLINAWFVTDSTVLLPVSWQLLAILAMTSAQGLKISGTVPTGLIYSIPILFSLLRAKKIIPRQISGTVPEVFKPCLQFFQFTVYASITKW